MPVCGAGYRVIALIVVAWSVSQALQLLVLLPSMDNYFSESSSYSLGALSSFLQQTMRNNTAATGRDAIFFNAFVPPPGVGAGPDNAIRIIKQQLAQRNISVMRDVPVYYTLIGKNISTEHIFTHNCHLLQYASSGNEELTLQSLFDYCLQNPSARVTYIHDKGSFNKRRANEQRRAYTTKAVFSKACATMEMCNICSLDFSVLPIHHAPGNMWTADCSYIQALIPPNQFMNKMNEMYASLETCASNSSCTTSTAIHLQPDMTWPDNYLGLGRHAMEAWAYSHPHVRPCATMEEAYMSKPSLDEWTPKLLKAPKQNTIRGIGPRTEFPWFQREGKLYQYDYLYGETPPSNSWFWGTYQHFKMTD